MISLERSGNFSASSATTLSLTAYTAAARSFLPLVASAFSIESPMLFSTAFNRAASRSLTANSRLGLPARRCSSSCIANIGCIASCAANSASRMTSSSTICAPPSSIMIDSGLAATTSDTSLPSSSVLVGLTTIFPSTRPILTDATGPLCGMSETSSAAEAAISDSMSGSLSRSAESTVVII